MKFESQYKQEMNKIAPTEEQLERIREGVEREISRKKKPLYLKVAAISGAAAVVLVIGITVIALPRMTKMENDAYGGGTMNAAPMHAEHADKNGGAGLAAADGAETNGGFGANGWTDSDRSDAGQHSGSATSPSAAEDMTSDRSDNHTDAPEDPANSAYQETIHLELSEDGAICVVGIDGKQTVYERSDEGTPLPEDAPKLSDMERAELLQIKNGVLTDIKTFVHFDENNMWIINDIEREILHFVLVN